MFETGHTDGCESNIEQGKMANDRKESETGVYLFWSQCLHAPHFACLLQVFLFICEVGQLLVSKATERATKASACQCFV